ncbi:IS110 family transposase [Rhodococcus sp. WS3]|uniref:IS110 family transposase n=1 Tax=Rhodococcus sp. WS3 TaxID=2486271 RepID=UPI0011426101
MIFTPDKSRQFQERSEHASLPSCIDRCQARGVRCPVASDQALQTVTVRPVADGRLDACVLAGTLCSDGHRWRPLGQGQQETEALRMMCRVRKDLVETRMQVMNQLRANLELAFPGALGLFSSLDRPIRLAFSRRFPIPEPWFEAGYPSISASIRTDEASCYRTPVRPQMSGSRALRSEAYRASLERGHRMPVSRRRTQGRFGRRCHRTGAT